MALTNEERQKLRTRLEEERDRLREEMRGLDAEIVALGQSQAIEVGGVGNHVADDATDISEQEKDIAIKRTLEDRLRDVEHALLRVDEGNYGVCEQCGKPIPAERLAALPSAGLCIECKSAEDRRHGF